MPECFGWFDDYDYTCWNCYYCNRCMKYTYYLDCYYDDWYWY